MSILVFSFLLFIYEIYLLVKNIKDNTKENNIQLLLTIIVSILSIALFFFMMYFSADTIGWNFIYYLLVSIMFFTLYIVMLIVSSIVISIKKRKDIRNDKMSVNKKLIINTFVIFVCFILSFLIELYPYEVKEKESKNTANKVKEQVLVLLNEKYGDGNFKILDTSAGNICENCFLVKPSVDGYRFIISSDYVKNNFVVSVAKDNFKLYKDTFLSVYYKEAEDINDLDTYLKDYKINRLNDELSKNFNVSISFYNTLSDKYIEEKFGRIPTIEELTSYVELYDPIININEELTKKGDLLNYLVKFTKYYINDFDKSNIKYKQTEKYFRYKYDYKKLMDTSEEEKNNNSNGYVLAGEYNYSYDKDKYILTNTDKLVRINILGKVSIYNLEDILKDN